MGDALLSLHKLLVDNHSTTGCEDNASKFLQYYLREKGFTVETQIISDGRENVYAYLGASRATKVLVTSHIDTVPPYIPYRREGDKIYGRGTVDAKGSIAAQVIAVESLLAEGAIIEGDVAMLFVVGEEVDGIGMRTANNLGISWESVIFGEPTELKLARGHKGTAGLTIIAKGKAGHSGYPETGKNAIDIIVQGLAAVQKLAFPQDPYFGETTVNVGTITGGVAINVIAADASATALVRVACEDQETIKELVTKALHEISPDLRLEFIYGSPRLRLDHDVEGIQGSDYSILKMN